MKVGFIGLGNLGSAIARRLIDQGVELTVWNRTRAKAEKLGATIAESPKQLISQVDVLFMCLTHSEAVEAVLIGDDGVLEGECRGKIVIDLTTNHFGRVEWFYEMVADAGGSYLESPVVGSVVPAQQGNLTVLISGDEATYDKVLPLIEKFGKHIFFLQEKTLATKMKLINNLALGAIMASVAEAVAFGEAAGLEKKKVLDILSVGGGKSLVLDAKSQKLLAEDFSPHFSVAMIYKDLHFLQDLAKSLGRPVFTPSIAKELYALAIAKDLGGDDFSAVYKVVR